jgi:hypothetical protein
VNRLPGDGRLFDVALELPDVEDMLAGCRRLRDDLSRKVDLCDRQINRLTALAHALREFIGDPAAAAVATRLTENGWSGTGDQLVTSTRAVLTQEKPW